MSDNVHEEELEVEAIIGRRVFRGKEKYRIKWRGYPEHEATWEPIEHLDNALDMVAEYNEKFDPKKREIDNIIGCGQRNGKKYFLVRFVGEKQNEMIDWDTAKKYSLKVMEYFGSRLVWTSIENIIDPENDEHLNDHADENTGDEQNRNDDQNQPSTSQSQHNFPPNEIEYDD